MFKWKQHLFNEVSRNKSPWQSHINRKKENSKLMDVTVRKDSDRGSDHYLLKLRLRQKWKQNKAKQLQKKFYNV